MYVILSSIVSVSQLVIHTAVGAEWTLLVTSTFLTVCGKARAECSALAAPAAAVAVLGAVLFFLCVGMISHCPSCVSPVSDDPSVNPIEVGEVLLLLPCLTGFADPVNPSSLGGGMRIKAGHGGPFC